MKCSSVVLLASLVLVGTGCPGRGGGGGGGGGGAESNLRPADSPDFVVVSVSGHNLGDSGDCEWWDDRDNRINCEYLSGRGTLEAIVQPAVDQGRSVEVLAFGDSFYSWTDPNTEQPIARGFLDLVDTLSFIEQEWVGQFDNPTRVIVVAHSHGVVWSHLALFLTQELPVDLLVDLDGESLSWESDNWSGELFPGDEWADVIIDYSVANAVTWDFEIWQAANYWDVPGVAELQDIEDIVPDNVLYNLEVASSSPLIQDGEPNYRADGSQDDIYRATFSEDHGEVTYPGSQPINWVRDAIDGIYSW